MSNFKKPRNSALEFKVLFLGTGVSTAVPSINHILCNCCQICADAKNVQDSKNKRNNVSIAIIFSSVDDVQKCVLVDVGKTMRDAVMTHLPVYNIQSVVGIILTHGHADACYGLDDVRDLQPSDMLHLEEVNDIGFRVRGGPMEMYLHKETMDTVKECFSYLTNEPEFWDKEQNILKRRVAYLNFNVIDYNATFNIAGLNVRSFPVFHGNFKVLHSFFVLAIYF
jgi:phosphoribosyl 1,2-cyclic phosphodiesterase